MKNILSLLFILCFHWLGSAQEFEEGTGLFFLPQQNVRASLSELNPSVSSRNLTLIEVNFSKKKKRQVNLVAMMERKRYEQERSLVELETPAPQLSNLEQGIIQITNELRAHDRSSNYDFYTGKVKIPGYQNMQNEWVPQQYSPYFGRPSIRPYFYSSFR